MRSLRMEVSTESIRNKREEVVETLGLFLDYGHHHALRTEEYHKQRTWNDARTSDVSEYASLGMREFVIEVDDVDSVFNFQELEENLKGWLQEQDLNKIYDYAEGVRGCAYTYIYWPENEAGECGEIHIHTATLSVEEEYAFPFVEEYLDGPLHDTKEELKKYFNEDTIDEFEDDIFLFLIYHLENLEYLEYSSEYDVVYYSQEQVTNMKQSINEEVIDRFIQDLDFNSIK